MKWLKLAAVVYLAARALAVLPILPALIFAAVVALLIA